MKIILFVGTFIFLRTPSIYSQFYKTPSGEKYHKGNCKMVENVSEVIYEIDLIKTRLMPCGICKPEKITLKNSLNNIPKGEKKETFQCNGITKEGFRCKHPTSIANGYCYQHSPPK